jgi:predicted  nucleic acid-binding Zn-ribbon protein|tara:strand:- start:3685 stop:4155 length:471 start_codon:yes stop_codon:yes gene_type:complete
MLEKIKNGLGKPAGWAYFILVVALLIIITKNGNVKDTLLAELDNANTEISTLEALNETTLEAMANEVAVRDDAIAGLNNAIAGWESDSVAVNARLNDSDTLRGELEVQIADLTARLNASASALDESASALETSIFALNDAKWRLDDAIANPNCPVQ